MADAEGSIATRSRAHPLAILVLTVVAASACGSAGAAVTAAAPPRVAAAPDVPCPKIVCQPNADYGQPNLAALKAARARIASEPRVTTGTATSGTTTAGGTASSGTAPLAASTGVSTFSGTASAGSASGSAGAAAAAARAASVAGPAGPVGPRGATGAPGPAGPGGADFAPLYTRYSNSVARFSVLDCGDQQRYTGSGFLIAPNLVATAAHVVNNSRIVALTIGGQVIPASTIGLDTVRDVALVRLSRPVAAPTVPLATAWPAVGSPLAVMGYALAGPLSMQQGHVSAVNVTVDGAPGFLLTDTTEDHGSSGGPVLDTQGRAVAIVSASIGISGMVKVHAGSIGAAQQFAVWKAHPRTISLSC